jgi:hypothetical protein
MSYYKFQNNPDITEVAPSPMENPRHRLTSARVSPMVEMARWIFELYDIPYAEEANAAVLHVLTTVRAGGGYELPVVVTSESVWSGAREFLIIEHDQSSGTSGIWIPATISGLLRHRGSGTEFIVIIVHMKSGYPAFLVKDDADDRRNEVDALAKWLIGQNQNGNFNLPPSATVKIAVIGDFNAQYNSPNSSSIKDPNFSLDPLSNALPEWTWQYPKPDSGRWETAIYNGDRYVIDYILFSPAMAKRIDRLPEIYACDCDAELGGLASFHLTQDCSSDLKEYNVSDHRPVMAVFKF